MIADVKVDHLEGYARRKVDHPETISLPVLAMMRPAGRQDWLATVDVEFIRKKHLVEGWSIRRISRQLDLARQTVRMSLSPEPPHYHLGKPRPCPIMDPHGEVIRTWLPSRACAGWLRLRPKRPGVFIPLTVAFGRQAQVCIAGRPVVAHLFYLRLRASGAPFAFASGRISGVIPHHVRVNEGRGTEVL